MQKQIATEGRPGGLASVARLGGRFGSSGEILSIFIALIAMIVFFSATSPYFFTG